MSSAMKKVNMISQIVRLRQVVQRWRSKSNFARRRGSLAVYVGGERRRFVIPTRFLNLPVFVDLLNQAEEEFGFQTSGGLALPCDAGFFAEILRLLDSDEDRYARFGVDEFWNQVYGLDFERLSCKETTSSARAFTPLLTKARV